MNSFSNMYHIDIRFNVDLLIEFDTNVIWCVSQEKRQLQN